MDEERIAEVYVWDPALGRYIPQTVVLAEDAGPEPDWGDWVPL